jgi:hypothetical protein
LEEKEHICHRMIQVIEGKGLILTQFEEKWKEEKKITVGYLARSAKENRSIGIKLIEHFLDEFPDTDVHWLITGKHLSINTDGNSTPVGKLPDEIQRLLETLINNNNGLMERIKELTGLALRNPSGTN